LSAFDLFVFGYVGGVVNPAWLTEVCARVDDVTGVTYHCSKINAVYRCLAGARWHWPPEMNTLQGLFPSGRIDLSR